MFTNWVLGTGPCGSTCSKADIGTSTRIKRANLGDKFYFGNFSTDFPITNSNNPDETGRIKNIAIQTLVMQNYTEAVLAVSEKDKWEQDLMKFSFELQPNKGREDLNILLNQTTRLHLPVIDKEGDFIKCSISTLMESGELRNTILKGVTVNQVVSIKDQNRRKIEFGPAIWNPATSAEYLSTCCVQIAVEESDEQRCFILEVQTKTFNTTAKSSYGKPYFVDLPASDDQFVCPVDTSCIIPIYIKSDRSIDRVRITEGKIDYVFGKIENITKAGEHLFQTSLTITSSLHGDDSLCLQAVTLDGVASETTCIQLTIEPKDPCYSTPCHNSGLCRVRNDSSGLFDCECLDGYSGPICAKALDRCQPNPCLHGDCYTSPRPYYCYCTDDHVLPNDFTGMNCEQKRDNCVGVGCSGHGVCVDGVLSHTCQCFPGYTGQTCETRSKYMCAIDDEDHLKNCTVLLYMASENGLNYNKTSETCIEIEFVKQK
ncbi:SLIT1-like protein, partial [Mya arenaria]